MTETPDLNRSDAPLTDKMKRFIDEYTGPSRLNATRSALAAGYSENTAAAIGWENLRKPSISRAIAERLKEFSMSAAEATERMAQFAQGSLVPFLTPDGHVDLSTDEAQDNLHLIRKLKMTTRYSKDGDKLSETFEIEIHDPKDALDKVLKLNGAYAQPEHQDVKFLLVRSLDEVEPSLPPSRAPKS